MRQCDSCEKRLICPNSPDYNPTPREFSILDRAELLNIEIAHRDFEEVATACEDFARYFDSKKVVTPT